MKVAIVTDFYPPEWFGGVEVTAARLVERLRADGHDVAVLTSRLGSATPEPGIHRVFTPYYRPERAARRRSAMAKASLDASTYWRARTILRRFRPDVVLVKSVRHISFRAVTAAFALRVPVVAYADDDWLVARRRACRIAGAAGRLRERFVYGRFAFATIACASQTLAARFVTGGFPRDRVVALPHGVDPAQFTPSPLPAARRLLFVGRLYPVKGPDLAIRAMRELRDRGHHDVSLTLIGAGDDDYARSLQQEVEAFGLSRMVTFGGKVLHDDLPALFPPAFAVVMPSRYDTFPLVALEAMASGRPLVAARVGGLPEIVTDGRDGLLVAPEDPRALADGIEQLLKDPGFAQSLGRAARESVVARYTEAAFFARLAAILERAISSRAGAS